MGTAGPTTYGAQPVEVPPQSEKLGKRKRDPTRTTVSADSVDDEVVFLKETKKSGTIPGCLGSGYNLEGDNLRKAKKTKKSPGNIDEEKRLRRWRAKPPRSFAAIKERALTQRMFVIDRIRGGTEDAPEETVDIAGTTGNIYTVTINKMPNCTCPYAEKGNQCKHIVYVLSRVLRAPEHLAYQLAFVSSELRDIFAKAPPVPSADSSAESSDGNRKPIENDCPICCMEFEEGREKIVYCKAACGNNIHRHCFEKWAATKKGSGAVTCPFCRTPWAGDEDMTKKIAKSGTVNSEGYVNVASQLGITGERDYSSYNGYWVRRQIRRGNIDSDHWFDDY
ncbi:hypothetical protein AOQ84DRAFT_359053 [Glonium stellatum]|uniref:Uncharacterized protein n=1 Tax=Glonium stellatum TaxID=574774 RepID=A0A8E2JYM3_9PEZI|nr:hypothetical protein AOQ84DRAFT_359053 [Glonium stellatum]